jgi:predicted CoA-binding protein
MKIFSRILPVTFATMFFETSEERIRKVLTTSRNIALVGASAKPERPAHYVMQYLLDHGYNVIPVNPGMEGKELLGQKVYASLSSIDEPVDMVDVFRNSAAVPAIVDEAISIGAKSIWMQVGVVNEEAALKAEKAGLDVVMNRCPKIEIPRLGGVGTPSASL